jgi:CBS domain-containing protein
VICPVCGTDNLTGAEVCDNCGADLGGAGVPQAASTFHSRLLGEHLVDLGAPAPATVTPDTPVGAAIETMHDASIDCLLVVDDGKLVGIFTDRDAVVRVAGKRLEASPIAEVMTPNPVTLRHDDPIALAIHRMAVGGFRHIPILQHGKPTGVVTARDVFHHLAEAFV